MKIYSSKMECIILFLFIVNVVKSAEILSIEGDAISGNTVVLKCTSDFLTGLLNFNNPDGNNAGTCAAPSGTTTNCGSSFSYNITQDVTNKVTYLTLPSCSSSHEGTWSCTQATTSTISLVCLNVSGVEVTGIDQNIKLKVSKEITVGCLSGCVYPGCKFDIQLVDEDNPSDDLVSVTTPGTKNSEETQRLGCTGSSEAYNSDPWIITKDIIKSHNPVKVKCILRVTSVTTLFPSALSNYTITGIPDVTTSTNEVTTNAIEASKTTSAESSSDNVENYIYGGVGGGVALIVVIGLVVCLIMWRRKKNIRLKGTDHQRENNGVM